MERTIPWRAIIVTTVAVLILTGAIGSLVYALNFEARRIQAATDYTQQIAQAIEAGDGQTLMKMTDDDQVIADALRDYEIPLKRSSYSLSAVSNGDGATIEKASHIGIITAGIGEIRIGLVYLPDTESFEIIHVEMQRSDWQ